jgi:hypothetical protein
LIGDSFDDVGGIVSHDTPADADLMVAGIWQLCQEKPRAGLNLLDDLPDELRATRDVQFGRFLALRQLALERFLHLQGSSLQDKSDDQLRTYFDGAHLEQAADALRALTVIQQDDPTRFDDWGIPEETIINQIDSLCIPLERLSPGSVQQILGWTKLAYMGLERIGLLPGVQERTSEVLLAKVVEVRFYAPRIARSAVGVGSGTNPDGRRFVDFFLMEQDHNLFPTFGDAGIFGHVRLYDDGNSEFAETEEDSD